MSKTIWSRTGPAAGLLFFPVMLVGFSIHGYPNIRPSDSQLASWLSTVDATSFKSGVYVEAIGTVLFVLFAAWLYTRLRRGIRDSAAPAVAMLAAAITWTAATLPINESWVGLVDQGRKGLDIHAAQTVVSINQAWYDMTGIVLGFILLAAGVAIVSGEAMARWVGIAAIVIGLFQVGSAYFGADATALSLLSYLWFFGVGGYYTFRPGKLRETQTDSAREPVAGPVPARS